MIPNGITLAGLVIGLAAILQAVKGNHVDSAWLIVLAVLTDKLDGTAARLLRATSDIGVQLDSFADFVAFGLAPAALVLSVVTDLGIGGEASPLWTGDAAVWLAYAMCITYSLCAAIRLATFNVLAERTKHRPTATTTSTPSRPEPFAGIPSTFAGALIAVAVILAVKYHVDPLLSAMPGVALVFGLLMVSRLTFPKVGRYPQTWLNAWQLINGVGGYICGIFRVLPEYLGGLLLIYLISGFIWGLSQRSSPPPTPTNA